MKITDAQGASVVFDPIGGPDFLKLMEALAVEGTAYLCGTLSEQVTPLPGIEFVADSKTVKGHNCLLYTSPAFELNPAIRQSEKRQSKAYRRRSSQAKKPVSYTHLPRKLLESLRTSVDSQALGDEPGGGARSNL